MASNLPFRCCDCGEDYNSKNKLEQHINVEHLSGWTPYWCLYCKNNGCNLKKATKEALEQHVLKMHPGEDFVFICKPDEIKEVESKDKLRRSLAIQSPVGSPGRINVNPLSPAPTPVSIPSMSSSTPSTSAPFSFTMDSNFQPKQEPMDESEFQPAANSTDFGLHCPSPLSSCKTCTQEIHNDRASKSEHVKEHFELQFGMRPTELMLLPDTMKQEFVKLLGDCFPDELNLFMNQPEQVPPPPMEPKQEVIDDQRPKIKCSICDKEYNSANAAALKYHEDGRMHWGTLKHETKHQCNKCDCKFHYGSYLRKHKLKMHVGKQTKREEAVVPPSPRTAKDKQVHCWCGKGFADERYLQLHEDGTQHHAESAKGLHKCKSCSKKYHFKGSLDKHAATHSSPTAQAKSSPSPAKSSRPKPKPSTPAKGKAQCNLCERIFGHFGALTQHMKGDKCPGKTSHRCNLCRQDFDDAEALQLHRENANHHDKSVKATKLGEPEPVLDEAEMPTASADDPAAQSFECPKCQKSFLYKKALQNHIAKLCGKIIVRRASRPNNMVECPDCGKSFNKLGALNMHRTRYCIGKGHGSAKVEVAPQKPKAKGKQSCSHCHRWFKSARSARIHESLVHKRPEVKPPSPAVTERPPSALSTCTPCATILSPSEIDNHLLTVHIDDFTTFCGVCNEGFQDWVNIAQAQEHIKEKHDGQGNVLDRRSEFGAKMWELREDLIEQNEKPKLKLEAVKCRHCRKWFTSKDKRQRHMNMVQKSKSLSAKVDIKQKKGDTHLMAKLCTKKSSKLAQKPKKRMPKAKIDKPKDTLPPELQEPLVDSPTFPPSSYLAPLPADDPYEWSVDSPTFTSIGYSDPDEKTVPPSQELEKDQKTSDGIPPASSTDTKIRIRRVSSSSSSSSGGSGFEIVKTKPGKPQQLTIKNELPDDHDLVDSPTFGPSNQGTSSDLSNKVVVGHDFKQFLNHL